MWGVVFTAFFFFCFLDQKPHDEWRAVGGGRWVVMQLYWVKARANRCLKEEGWGCV
jgi:hypothetical protein